jgi:hypothetical protein
LTNAGAPPKSCPQRETRPRTIAVLTNGVKRDILAVLFYETDFH